MPPKTPIQKIQIKRCPKCSWPMNVIRKMVYPDKVIRQGWTCPNKNCNYKEGL